MRLYFYRVYTCLIDGVSTNMVGLINEIENSMSFIRNSLYQPFSGSYGDVTLC